MKRLNSIEWHEECLANAAESLNVAKEAAARMNEGVETLRLEIAFYVRQIAEAKRRGLETFDRDRLLVSRKKSAPTP